MKNVDISKLRNDIIEGMKLVSQKLKAQKNPACGGAGFFVLEKRIGLRQVLLLFPFCCRASRWR